MRIATETIVFNHRRNVELDAYTIEQDANSTLPTAIRPAVIVCPGGGYNHISEAEGLPAILPFLSDGYQAFILSYSINDDSRYPNPLVDLSIAMRWVRANAERFHIDPDRIAVLGFSAGGHCAAMLATQWHLDHWKAHEHQELLGAGRAELEQFSNQPNAAILCYATTDLFAFPNLEKTRTRESGIGAISVERLPESNPIDHISEHTCPVFLWHTTEDDTVPAQQSVAFAGKLLDAGVPVELHLYERGAHGLSVATGLTNYEGQGMLQSSVPGWVNLAIVWLNQHFER
jgi:acetyl esterase/lipase